MRTMVILVGAMLLTIFTGSAQVSTVKDYTINNLVHTPGYRPSEFGAIPHYSVSV